MNYSLSGDTREGCACSPFPHFRRCALDPSKASGEDSGGTPALSTQLSAPAAGGALDPLSRGAVIVAAGRGTRMGEDKVWLPLGGVPVVAYSLRAFAESHPRPRVALVVSRDNLSRARGLVNHLGIDAVVCAGGERRQESVQNGLAALGGVSLVAIHDGARPLVSPELIERCYAGAAAYGAAVPGVQVRDTLKRVSGDGWIVETVDRAALWGVQTPQAFRMDLLLEAYAALQGEVTDDASVVEALGRPVKIVPGDPRNLKLTTREDLVVARALLGLPETEVNR